MLIPFNYFVVYKSQYAFLYHYSSRKDTKFLWIVWNQSGPHYTYAWGRWEIKLDMIVLLHFLF